jgi:hypothetical protein
LGGVIVLIGGLTITGLGWLRPWFGLTTPHLGPTLPRADKAAAIHEEGLLNV